MARPRFPLSAEQMDLLIAFDQCNSLSKLASYMAKDPSVISRNLQRLADEAPVLAKTEGRWQISPLGRQVIGKASLFRDDLSRLIDEGRPTKSKPRPLLHHAALLVVNAQRGLLDRPSGGRSNLDAEKNLHILMATFREKGRPVIHLPHVTQNPASLFCAGTSGAEFMPNFEPMPGDVVVEKTKPSGFSGSRLSDELNQRNIETVVIGGFTAHECIDATARQAGDLGFSPIVVSDATASFDVHGPNGDIHPADRVHQLIMANLHNYYAQVMTSAELLPHI